MPCEYFWILFSGQYPVGHIKCSFFPDHEWECEEEEELADLVARHEVGQLLRLDPELALHRRQRRREVRVAHPFNEGNLLDSVHGTCWMVHYLKF